MPLDPYSIGMSVAAVVAGAMAGFERWNSKKATERAAEAKQAANVSNEVLGAKDELIRLARESAESWKVRHEAEHAEANRERELGRMRIAEIEADYVSYRQKHHQELNDANTLVLRVSEENASLRAKTDISPILEHQRMQSQINAKIIQALDKILERVGYEAKRE